MYTKKPHLLFVLLVIFFTGVLSVNAVAQNIHLTSVKPVFSTQRIGKLTTSADSSGRVPQIGIRKFTFGLNTYANSEIVYILNGKYSHFEAWVGLESKETKAEEAFSQVDGKVEFSDVGKVTFQVFTDGNKVYDSGSMDATTSAKQVQLDVSGVNELELFVIDLATGGNPNHSKNTAKVNWADPMLTLSAEKQSSETTKAVYEVKGGNSTTVKLDQNGRIAGLFTNSGKKEVSGGTNLPGCREIKLLEAKKLPGAGMQFSHLFEDARGNQCIVTESFRPTENSVRWDVDITGNGNPWSSAIVSSIKMPVAKDTRFWTAWSHPDLIGQGYWNNEKLKTEWIDPLQIRSFTNSSRWFGGNPLMYVPTSGDLFSIPIATFINDKTKEGFSFIQSPEDSLLYMKLVTTEDGTMEFQRRNHRIEKGRHVRFAMDLVTHENDWRSGLGWMVKRYPAYFEPANPKAHDVGGCGAYSSWEGELDADKLKKMAFKFNWKASFDFPYMGMFLPPVAEWQTFATSAEAKKDPWVRTPYKGAPTSRTQLENYSALMKSYGFHVLNYFNVTEFGTKVKGPESVNKNVKEEDLWKNCNDFLHTKIADGILYNKDGSGDYYKTWGDAIVMDPGAKDYQDFIIEQAQRQIDYLPSSSGICIDRMDWLTYLNINADDGMTWYEGNPARSLFNSWRSLMERMGPMMHKRDLVIFLNPMVAMRLDMMKHGDGIYSEHNELGPGLNSSVFLGLCKPVVAWTWDEKSFEPDPDYYLQRFLYLGVFPSAPVPDNNHEISPGEFSDKWYLKYGSLFNSMMKRQWVLKPNIISVVNNDAKANFFTVPDGYVMPVVMAEKGLNSVDITVNILQKDYLIDVLLPGDENPVQLITKSDKNGKLLLSVPLKDRCALVRFKLNK